MYPKTIFTNCHSDFVGEKFARIVRLFRHRKNTVAIQEACAVRRNAFFRTRRKTFAVIRGGIRDSFLSEAGYGARGGNGIESQNGYCGCGRVCGGRNTRVVARYGCTVARRRVDFSVVRQGYGRDCKKRMRRPERIRISCERARYRGKLSSRGALQTRARSRCGQSCRGDEKGCEVSRRGVCVGCDRAQYGLLSARGRSETGLS